MVLFWDRYAQRENRAFATVAEREGQTEQQHTSRLCYAPAVPFPFPLDQEPGQKIALHRLSAAGFQERDRNQPLALGSIPVKLI